MKQYIELYHEEIIENQKILLNLINNINEQTPLKKVKDIVTIFCYTGTGLYSSYKLEEYFLNISKKIKIELENSYIPQSTLHIMTQAYESGGHTRVVERWIENASDNERHSVFITNQKLSDVNESLKKIVEQKGNIYTEYNEDDIETSKKLRKIANKYEKIILHTHMDDIIPLLAFGTEDFKRPVLLYNHADHLAWVGISIADLILELRRYGMNITKYKRGCDRQHKLGIPVYKPNKLHYKTKKDLNLPEDKMIILSCGGEHKYFPIADINIFDIIKYITDRYDILFILIGINNPEKFNIKQYEIKSNKLLILKEMKHKDLMSYINIADIVLDSLPMSGATALTDAVALHKAVISGCSLVGQLDYIANSVYYATNIERLKQSIENQIISAEKRNENIKEIEKLLEENDSLECFKKNLELIDKIRPDVHSIYQFKECNNSDLIGNDVYRCIFNRKEKTKLNLRWLKVIKYKNKVRKCIVIKFFNKSIKICYKRYT